MNILTDPRCPGSIRAPAAGGALAFAILLACAPVGAQTQGSAPAGAPAQPAAAGQPQPAPPAAASPGDAATEELRREIEILKQQVAELQRQRTRKHGRPGSAQLKEKKEEPQGDERSAKKNEPAPAAGQEGAPPAGKAKPPSGGAGAPGEMAAPSGDGQVGPSDEDGDASTSDEGGRWESTHTPGNGFDLIKTRYGLLNIGGYTLFRYLNQMPDSKTFTDHLGNVRPTEARNDLQWHRALLYVRGYLFTPKLTFSDSVWGLQSSGQMSMVGSLNYNFGKSLQLSGGILSLPGTYTLLFNFPYWLGTDRVMANEFFRPGFTGGLSASGDIGHRLTYTAMVGNTISQLGVPAFHLTRDHAYSADLAWMPTTGEYGPRNGELGDYHEHQKVATRFDAFYTFSREDRFSQPSEDSPENTQIRLSDSVLFFEAGALAPGVTVDKADYNLLAAHAGVKHLGTSLDVELYKRWLNTFRTIGGPAPLDTVRDEGYYVQASRMVVNRKLMLYGFHSYVFGQFNDSWEAGSGINWYPFGQRNFRLNGQGLYIFKSPTSSQFGYYSGGMTGGIWSLATDMLF